MKAARVLALLLLVTACGQPTDRQQTPAASASAALPTGGTLRIATPALPPTGLVLTGAEGAQALDPHGGTAWYDSAELFRCCLLRTLVSYVGRPTDQGGTELRPDLAESLPEVSSDGLAWTFHLKHGVRYAPPLADTEITSSDFVRAFLRLLPRQVTGLALDPGIVGVSEFRAGSASTISGLETPDRYTLRVRLKRPAGNLPARFAFPDVAPIPPSPHDPAAPLGVATGHDDDYGRFLVAAGPYMVEGSEQIDFSAPAAKQQPASGFVPGTSLTLVRNPSWSAALDDLRPAYVDRIEIKVGGDLDSVSTDLDKGAIDLSFYAGPPPQTPLEQVERYRADPGLGQVRTNPRDFVRAIALNLALPPFDDIHVRKAVSLAIDKSQLIELAGGAATGEVAGHIVLNSLEDNILLAYDPYRTSGSHGDPEAARKEMAQSKYDGDGDGRCDDPACQTVPGVTFRVSSAQAELVTANLAEIGIKAAIELVEPQDSFGRWFNPKERLGFIVGLAYGKDDLNAASYFSSNFDSRTSLSDDVTNGTMVGASAERLKTWGYAAANLPNVDDRIDDCLAKTGGSMVECWAALDQYLMENVVAWVPYTFENYIRAVSNRVVHYSFDQSMAQPALDQIAVKPGG